MTTTEQQLVGLLQRADWTMLSLTATVSRRFNRVLRDEQLRSMPLPPRLSPWARTMTDPDDLPMTLGDQVTGTLLVAPGCRFREELTDEDGGTATSGCDGDRGWVVNPRVPRTVASDRYGESGWRVYAGGPAVPPFDRLLCPSWVLTGWRLRIEGAVAWAGREALRVVAVPQPPDPGALVPQRYDLVVDTELGILLRCEAFVRGRPLSLEELAAVRIQPPEVADESRFAVPPDALKDVRDFAGEVVPPGVATATGLAADALGFAIRHGPSRPRRPPADGGEPMPQDADRGQEDWPPVSDELAYLLYRAAAAERDIAAELSEWVSVEGFAEGLRRGGRKLGQGGVGRLADAISERAVPGTTHLVARLVLAADGVRYRLDWVAGAPRRKPVTEACDGQTSWRVYSDRTVTGPARPVPLRVTSLLRPSWLLQWRLSGGDGEIVDGRRGFRVRAASIPGVTSRGGPTLSYDAAVAVIDAELGVITRLTSYAAGRAIGRWELRTVRVLASTNPEDFRIRAASPETWRPAACSSRQSGK